MEKSQICLIIDNCNNTQFACIEQDPINLLGQTLSKKFEVSYLILVPDYNNKKAIQISKFLLNSYNITTYFQQISDYTQWKPDFLQKSKATYDFFYNSVQHFDIVLFPDSQGIAYLCLKCKKSFPCFNNSQLGLFCNNPTQRRHELERIPLGHENTSISDCEKACAGFADFIIFPSQDVIHWMNQKRWTLPDHQYYVPDGHHWKTKWEIPIKTEYINPDSIRSIICYAPLQDHQGFPYFLEALGLIPKKYLNNKQILIVTPETTQKKFYIQSTLLQLRQKDNKIRIQQVSKISDISDKIHEPNQLWVFPSEFDTTSQGILFCLNHKTPFICTNRGGHLNLIDRENHETCLFASRPQNIAKKLIEIFESEKIPTPKPSDKVISSEKDCYQVFEKIKNELIPMRNDSINDENPLISIIIPTYNRPKILPEAVKSALSQTYTNTEIIIVNDGSTDPEVKQVTEELEQLYNNIRIVHQENKYLGAARNTGVRQASGEFIVFLDDDDLLFPEYIKKCLEIAIIEDADCVIPSPQVSSPWSKPHFWLFAGGGYPGKLMPSSIIQNSYGTSCIFVRRKVCIEHPYHEAYRSGWEDWSFLMDIHLSGFNLSVYPHPLFNYRISDAGMNKTTSLMGNFLVISKILEKYGYHDLATFGQLIRFPEPTDKKKHRLGLFREILIDKLYKSETIHLILQTIRKKFG